MISARTASLHSALVALLLAAAGPAWAGFIVCNQSFDVVNVAIGQEAGDSFRTDGWWTIGTNQCANVVKTPLANRYVYVYATDVFGQPLLDGKTQMCIAARKFTVTGTANCWQRGNIAVPFLEIDTGSSDRWTFFLKQPEGN